MAAITTSPTSDTRTEDALAHLPVSNTTEYDKGQIIYGPPQFSKSIYLVVAGKVGISQVAGDGSEVLLDIVRPDELFGESAFLDVPPSERATAIENVKVMAWAVSDMEDLVTKRPRLAVAMLQILAQRNAEFTRRIESFSNDTIERRLARSLIRFSERLGTPDGRWVHTDDAAHSRAAVTVRRHLARDHQSLYESVPETRLCQLFAARYRPLWRYFEDCARLKSLPR